MCALWVALLGFASTWGMPTVEVGNQPFCNMETHECWPEGRPREHAPLSVCTEEPKPGVAVPRAAYANIPETRTVLCPPDRDRRLWKSTRDRVEFYGQGDVMDVMLPWTGARPRSRTLGQATAWVVANDASGPVEVFWVGFDGAERFQETIASNDTLVISSFQGHVFNVRSAKTHRILATHTIGMTALRNTRRVPCERTRFRRRESEQPQHTADKLVPLNCNHISVGFRNTLKCPIDVFFWNGTGELLAFQLRAAPRTGWRPKASRWGRSYDSSLEWPPHTSYESAYLTHRFRVRSQTSGELITETVIRRTRVGDCPDEIIKRAGGERQHAADRAAISSNDTAVTQPHTDPTRRRTPLQTMIRSAFLNSTEKITRNATMKVCVASRGGGNSTRAAVTTKTNKPECPVVSRYGAQASS